MPGLHEQLLAQVDHRSEDSIALLRQLVQASQGGDESVQALVAQRLRDLGCRVETIRRDPRTIVLQQEFAADAVIEASERVSVVGKLPGAGGGQSLMLFAHPDGEAVSDLESWRHIPFAGTVEDGRMYGWGVADDLLGVATMLAAADAVAGVHCRLKGDVFLASCASKRHARGIAAVLERGYRADGAVYLHPAESERGMQEIKAFTSGVLRFRIRVPGRLPDTAEPNHTPFYHLAVDPIDKAWSVYAALRGLAERRARDVHHSLLDSAIGRSTNLQLACIRCGDERALSRVSPECLLAGSVTFPPGERLPDVQRAIEETVAGVARSDKWLRDHPPVVEWLMGASGAEVPAEHPLYRTVSSAVTAVTGGEPRVNPLHSASDIRCPMLQAGVPTVGLGSLAGDLSQSGGHDEWVDLADYLRGVKVCASIMVDWCGI